MAEKKVKPKAKAKAEPKAEEAVFDAVELPEVEIMSELEKAINEPVNPVHTASDLAQMARNAKAGKADMQDVIKAHEAYLKAIAQGASAPAADVEFVKNHMKYLKTL